MKRISTDAKLSRTYTNHCVGRATTITELKNMGYSDENIILLTRHHNVEGKIISYYRIINYGFQVA